MKGKFLDFFFENENIVGHGNFKNIDERYNLLAEKESVDRSIRQIPQTAIIKIPQKSGTVLKIEAPQEKQKEDENLIAPVIETEKENKNEDETKSEDENKNTKFNFSSETNTEEDFSYTDDETLRKIYETINKINEFEKRSKALRKLKFAKRGKFI